MDQSVSTAITVSATEFKAKCLGLLDQLARGEVEQVTVTKRGLVVGVLTPPVRARQPSGQEVLDAIYEEMRGSVTIPPGYDLTASVCDDAEWDAEQGILHR